MFEAVELDQTLSREKFKAQEPETRAALLAAQRELREKKIATLILVAGVEGAGKGEVINRLNKWFDARGVFTHAFWDETDEELARPANWRFWRKLPAKGAMAFMFGGWYWDPLYQYTRKEISAAEIDEAATKITDLERMLHQDGMLIIKLWFHISRKTHTARLKNRKKLSKHISVLGDENREHEKYGAFIKSAERLILHTDNSDCPWHLIEADDKWHRDMSVAKAILAAMEQRLHEHRTRDRRATVHPFVTPIEDKPVTILDHVDLDVSLSQEDYVEQRNHYQRRLNELAWQAYDARRSTIAVFEGWDAAGKGGAIQRATNAIDPRLYQVISVGAPSDEERAHHYLWRFWRHVPRAGYMTLFDRSWYGRVLVERVEGFAEPHEWLRAYHEINSFEEQLVEQGSIIAKFWLHISPEEQLRRFQERKTKPWKQHKITDEDWRNREKWEAYRQAVNTMVEHTSLAIAPWTLVPANDKRYARVMVLKTLCTALEQALAKS
ncbi:MAG: polyphosphate:AMP phosphotransferase [Acidiferrobacterales bacterium]|jgi:polyphosphate:AMP phosphotransferase|nr:polyphosphate:AMP phosphotransferase [Acidiferrobacterales bacterium]